MKIKRIFPDQGGAPASKSRFMKIIGEDSKMAARGRKQKVSLL
jgi:hypothetical protein